MSVTHTQPWLSYPGYSNTQVWVFLNVSGLTLGLLPAGCLGTDQYQQQKVRAHGIANTSVTSNHILLNWLFSEGDYITSKMKRMESSSSLWDLWPETQTVVCETERTIIWFNSKETFLRFYSTEADQSEFISMVQFLMLVVTEIYLSAWGWPQWWQSSQRRHSIYGSSWGQRTVSALQTLHSLEHEKGNKVDN